MTFNYRDKSLKRESAKVDEISTVLKLMSHDLARPTLHQQLRRLAWAALRLVLLARMLSGWFVGLLLILVGPFPEKHKRQCHENCYGSNQPDHDDPGQGMVGGRGHARHPEVGASTMSPGL
ncbi:hypothetical protein SAY86_021301 [Trapa natans]|uniref:Uncharacterized protein n=1 Tax=Trapa natans TaxID=22666 RepID=A0AAN7M8G0_TRANT|nr:hypothetical protein SAY86_021301 [Trapa natans]